MNVMKNQLVVSAADKLSRWAALRKSGIAPNM
jgi:hypothetical protein